MKHTKVSILIPSFNASKWIEQAVESALSQTWPEKEVIVIDDGSSDSSVSILESFGKQIQLIARENRGGNQTRNELLKAASGDWLQFLDADDYLLPEKIEKQILTVEDNPGTAVVYGPLIIEHHSIDGRVSKSEWSPHDTAGNHDPWAYHLGWNLCQTGGVLLHRETLLAAGGWNEAQPCCQDNELFFRLLKAGVKFTYNSFAGAVYRRFPGGSVSTSRSQKVSEEILRLLDAGEAFLDGQHQLTDRRRQAANQNRLALARTIWPHDRNLAMAIHARIRKSDPKFIPEPQPHTPVLYRIAFRLLGFRAAEAISSLKRKIRPS